MNEEHNQIKRTLKDKLKGIGCVAGAVGMLTASAIGIRACYLTIQPPPEIRKEMQIGKYHIVARNSHLFRELSIYTPDNWRPALKADNYHADRRFTNIEISGSLPRGDSLENYVNLPKLEEAYQKTMSEGTVTE